MRIIHVIIAAAYREGFGYQENLLAQKHKELGCDVGVITWDRYNQYGELLGDSIGVKRYVNYSGVRVVVLPTTNDSLRRIPVFGMCFNRTKYLYEMLEEESPDVIFVHGIQAADHEGVVRYKHKHPSVRVYADNHNDYYNGPVKTLKDKIQRRVLGRKFVQDLAAVCETVWAVTPWREEYLLDVYGLPRDKVKLLVMGGDENKIDITRRDEIRHNFKKKHNIPEDAFIVVSGGKNDKAKNTHLLYDAVLSITNHPVYLVLFGSYSDDLKYIEDSKDTRVINIGWIPSEGVYDIFMASDLAVFPGTHSVLWEQACACGLPALFKDWNGGFSHVDVGGNSILLKDVTAASLKDEIVSLIENKERYDRMLKVATTVAMKVFSYKEIAKESIEEI